MGKNQIIEEIHKIRVEEIYGNYRQNRVSCEEAAEILKISVRIFYRKWCRYDYENFNGSFDQRIGRKSPQALDTGDLIPFVVPTGIDFFNPQVAREAFSIQKRLFPFLSIPFHQVWSYILIPPPGYHFGRLSKDKSVENSMGSFSSTHRIEKDRLVVTRTLIANKAYLSAEDYGLLWQIINAYEQESRSIDALIKDKTL